ncbi:MAG: delta-class carbonic anhydrase [Acidobacteriota bacterium]|jgi:hypothetical protein
MTLQRNVPFLFAVVCMLTVGCQAEPDPVPEEEPVTEPAEVEAPAEEAAACGPQSPRDITQTAGTNPLPVPDGDTPNLCNVHFHEPFEHAGFAEIPEVEAAAGDPVCQSVEVGDEVEFHWVYTNCDLPETPVQGLDNCVCERDDMVLRVYAQAYVVGAAGVAPSQPESSLVSYTGSTTGPSYDNATCSPARVNWEVAETVEVAGLKELGAWCEENPWPGEDHPHGSRELVTDPAWLSAM